MWYVYVLQSLKNNRLYVGMTNALQRRFKEHNNGIGGRYTRYNRPFRLIYYEACLEKRDAVEAERFYKSGSGREIFKKKLQYYFL